MKRSVLIAVVMTMSAPHARSTQTSLKRAKDCRQNISAADQKLLETILVKARNLSKQDLSRENRQLSAWTDAGNLSPKIPSASRAAILTELFLRRFEAYPHIAARHIKLDCNRFEEWLQRHPGRFRFDVADFILHYSAPYLSWKAPTKKSDLTLEESFAKDFDRLHALNKDNDVSFQQAVSELGRQVKGSVKGAVIPHRNPFDLSRAEWLALLHYTGGDYAAVNQDLRHNKGAAYPTYIRILNAALSKLPKFEGTVYRGAKFPAEVRARHREGMVFDAEAFTSTSASQDEAELYGREDFAIIQSKSGRIVNNYGALSGEDSEILFPSGTRFRVNRIEVDGNNRRYFMDEL